MTGEVILDKLVALVVLTGVRKVRGQRERRSEREALLRAHLEP